jgi:hypothetical protein
LDCATELSIQPVAAAIVVIANTREQVLGHCPVGIWRALHRLPGKALQQQNYQRLVLLLADPDSAKVLHHAPKIDDLAIHVDSSMTAWDADLVPCFEQIEAGRAYAFDADGVRRYVLPFASGSSLAGKDHVSTLL